jgi:hypothetical protein
VREGLSVRQERSVFETFELYDREPETVSDLLPKYGLSSRSTSVFRLDTYNRGHSDRGKLALVLLA